MDDTVICLEKETLRKTKLQVRDLYQEAGTLE